jgi:hypothetical protein
MLDLVALNMRRDILIAERKQHAIQAEKQDYGYAVAIGEIEQLIALVEQHQAAAEDNACEPLPDV